MGGEGADGGGGGGGRGVSMVRGPVLRVPRGPARIAAGASDVVAVVVVKVVVTSVCPPRAAKAVIVVSRVAPTGAPASRLPARLMFSVALAGAFCPKGSLMSWMVSVRTPSTASRPWTMNPLVDATRRPFASSWKLPERV